MRLRIPRFLLVTQSLVAAAMLVTTLPAAAQGPTARVVVRAVTSDGAPVLDLKREDVSLRIDGRAREIKDLELVQPSRGGAPAPQAGGPAATLLPAPYSTNAAAAAVPRGGREFLVLVDDEGIGPGREAPVRAAITTLAKSLSPNDRLGLVAMKQGGMNISPTGNHGAIVDELSRLVTIGSASESEVDLTCRTKLMLGTLGGFLRGASPERTIVFFSPGVAQQSTDAVRQITNPQAGQLNSQPCEIRADDLEELGRSASSSGAQMFVVAYPDGMANGNNLRLAQAGLQNIAGVTGAEHVTLSGAPDAVATRIGKTAGIYYLATLSEPVAGRRYDVRVNREGLRTSAGPAAGAAEAATAAGGKRSLRDMIRVATVFRDLPLRAAGFISRQPKSDALQLMVVFEPEEPGIKLNAATVILFDEKGESKAQWNAQPKDLERSPVLAATMAPPGRYRMRVAATDANGRGGTTDVDLNVQLADAAPYKMGSLVMSTDQNSPKLLFKTGDPQVIGFLPIYGTPKGATITARYEIRPNEKDTELGSTEGRVLEMPGDPDARMIWGGFGLEPLAPGDYLMRVVVNVDGKPVGTATRTLRKVK